MAKAVHRHVSSKKPHRTRSDYRTFCDGSFEYYLVHRYPLKEDYHPQGDRGTKILCTERDVKGNYLRLDRSGNLEHNSRFIGNLSTIPHIEIKNALLKCSEMENGREMMEALDWYQKAEVYKAQGHAAEDRAASLGISVRTLRRRMYECARLTHLLIIKAESEKAA